MDMGGMHDGMGWWMMAGWIWFLLFWGSLIALVVWAVGRGRGSGDGPDAMEIAEERLARGEIDEEQFQRIKRNLA
ncbi:MAG: SHOCT domain-containing protein [Dehalococcoidia bacterium]